MSDDSFPSFNIYRHRLHYAAAGACGAVASLTTYIICGSFGIDLSQVLPGEEVSPGNQFAVALMWWAMACTGFIGAYATQIYLTVAAREHERVYRLALRFLIILVFAVAIAAGIVSKSASHGGTADVIAGLIALSLGWVCAYCGSRLAYLNAKS